MITVFFGELLLPKTTDLAGLPGTNLFTTAPFWTFECYMVDCTP